ncbi:ATP-binding protein [Parapedobacter soli]|uniref:ATP-binding protein n=1 Tax=Parapedobacter soli TaxID=416955 RepID=UPI0021CAB598|nr:ATP-binding protein [Parapedobacter soli]
MILETTLTEIVKSQKLGMKAWDAGLRRTALNELPNLAAHALIVTGIRRSGKSTLLFQLLRDKYKDALYLNFEDPRLYEFEPADFVRLDTVIKQSGSEVLMFDEIQIIPRWESYVRQKLDERYKLVITGSNASLLSRELGTKLTGRHISTELFPFSYLEFITFKELKADKQSIVQYLQKGGFPEYVKEDEARVLAQLFDDIILRDIVVRYGVRDVRGMQRLAQYLVTHIGNRITANRLKSLFDFGSTSTINEYLSHLEHAYLLHFVPKFSYSQRAQLVNPRKVYAIDTGIVNTISTAFTEDQGRKFENLIYLHLRRSYKEIYYFSEKGECDFTVFSRGTFQRAIQVCYSLNQDNLDRELNGLVEALEYFKSDNGCIITLDQTDRFEKNGKTIDVLPAYVFCNSSLN